MAGVALDPAVLASVQALKFEDADGEPMIYVSSRSLEPERKQIYGAAFPEIAEASTVVAILAESGGTKREFIATVSPPSAQLVTGSCQITFEDVQACECVEYAFGEAPDAWHLAQLTREALESYRSMKFNQWKEMLLTGTCEAQLRRMLQIGVVTRLFDTQIFPTPEEFKSLYQVTDERSGKLINLPHPVVGLRAWNSETARYDSIEPQLTGAPPEAEKEAWWQKFVQELKGKMGTEYIESFLKQ